MLITPMYKPKNIIFKAWKDCPVETTLPGEFQIGHETKLLLKEIRTSTVFWLLKHFGTDAISSVVKQSSKDITRFLTDIIRHPVLIFRRDVMFWLRESLWTSRFGFTKKLRKLSTTIEKENFWMHRLNWHLLIISQDQESTKTTGNHVNVLNNSPYLLQKQWTASSLTFRINNSI